LGGEILVKLVKSLIITFFMIFLVGCTAAWGAEDRYYLRLAASSTSLAGDFQGNSYAYLTDPSTPLFYVPEIEDGDGFGIAIGGYRGHLGGEISFLRTSHNCASDAGYDGDTTYQKINFDVKLYLFKYEEARFNMYGLFGFGLPQVKVDYSTVSDVTFKGKAFNAGAGFLLRFTDKLALEATYIYSKLDVSKVDYEGGKYKYDDKFESDENTMTLGLNYYF
jgi:opacity protein-like surface antigen